MTNGFHILPGNVRGAVRFITEEGAKRVRECWAHRIETIAERAEQPVLEPLKIREGWHWGNLGTRAKLHIPLLQLLLEHHEMGGKARCKQFISGFLMLGHLAGRASIP